MSLKKVQAYHLSEGSLLSPIYKCLSATLRVEIYSLGAILKYIFFTFFLISPSLVNEVYNLLVNLKDTGSASIAIGFVLMKYHVYFIIALRYLMYNAPQNIFFRIARFIFVRLASWMYILDSDWDISYPDMYSTQFWASSYGHWCMFSFFFTMFNCIAIGYIIVYFLQMEYYAELEKVLRRGPSLRGLLARCEARAPIRVLMDQPRAMRCSEIRISTASPYGKIMRTFR